MNEAEREPVRKILLRWRYEDDYGLDDAIIDLRRALSPTARAPDPDERMTDALHKIKQWAEAYPPDIFHIPTSDEWRRLHEAAQAAGLNGIDAFARPAPSSLTPDPSVQGDSTERAGKRPEAAGEDA